MTYPQLYKRLLQQYGVQFPRDLSPAHREQFFDDLDTRYQPETLEGVESTMNRAQVTLSLIEDAYGIDLTTDEDETEQTVESAAAKVIGAGAVAAPLIHFGLKAAQQAKKAKGKQTAALDAVLKAIDKDE